MNNSATLLTSVAAKPSLIAEDSRRLLSGAALLIDTLVKSGIDTIFGYPGGAVLPLYDALHADSRIRHVLVRHEQAAVHAAEGYAKSSGKVGVVLVTSGPGVANTISGLLDATCDSVAVLCVSGQVGTESIGTDAFQECDALGISRPVTKWSHQIGGVSEVRWVTEKALAIAVGGRPGPVLIDFPKDIQSTLYDEKNDVDVTSARVKNASFGKYSLPKRAIRDAADLILGASRPIFYGGGGLVSAGPGACDAFSALVRRTGAPCTLTLMGLGAFPASERQFIGMLGMHGTLEANLAMHEADLIICVGARFDDRVTGKLSDFSPNSKKIHIDIDPTSINKVVKADIPIVGDCQIVLEALNRELQLLHPSNGGRLSEWWKRIGLWRNEKCLAFKKSKSSILPQALLSAINDHLAGRDAIVSTDVGQHQMWAAQYLRFNQPRRFLTSGGAGTMGFGLPAAIGAQIAHPGKLVVCVSGDASVLMNIQELSTAVQHRCPVKLVIANNGYMGMVRQWQELIYESRYSHSYTEALPDFVMLARAFGWDAFRVETPDQLGIVMEAFLSSPKPCLLDVKVAEQSNCFPMMPAGCGHHEIMLSATRWYEG